MKKKEEIIFSDMKVEFGSLLDLQKIFPTEQHCVNYLEAFIWKGKTPVSPYDPTSQVYKCAKGWWNKSSKDKISFNRYKCKNTGKYFNVKTGTIFENSKLPLLKWIYAFYFYSSHKKGISSLQLAKYLKVNKRTAWFVLHRMRHASDIPLFKEMLKDFVEIDETYSGGANPNRHWNKKVPRCQGRSWKDKVPILVIIKRGGNVIAIAVPNVKRSTLEPIIRNYVKEGSDVYTDEWLAYKHLNKWYNHQIVIHRIKQYVSGKASTNSAENFNSCLKRGIYGTYHWIKRKNTQRYVNEFTFRYNTRKYSEQERFDLLLSSVLSKRLTYQQLIS